MMATEEHATWFDKTMHQLSPEATDSAHADYVTRKTQPLIFLVLIFLSQDYN